MTEHELAVSVEGDPEVEVADAIFELLCDSAQLADRPVDHIALHKIYKGRVR